MYTAQDAVTKFKLRDEVFQEPETKQLTSEHQNLNIHSINWGFYCHKMILLFRKIQIRVLKQTLFAIGNGEKNQNIFEKI